MTRIEQEYDRLVNTYAVQHVNTELPDQTDLDIYKAERNTGGYLDRSAEKLDVMCFPTLYPYGRGGENETRPVPLGDADFTKSRLYSSDPKYRRSPDYVFYMHRGYRMRAVISGIFNLMRSTVSLRDKSVADVLNMIKDDDDRIERNIRTIFGQVRRSSELWAERQRDLRAMIRHLGSPTWFLTLSAAEYDWEDMRETLIALNSDVPGIEQMRNGERCAFDSVNTCRHFHKRFRECLHRILLNKNGL